LGGLKSLASVKEDVKEKAWAKNAALERDSSGNPENLAQLKKSA